jgi:DNA-binding transcriptional ArsR family regulator
LKELFRKDTFDPVDPTRRRITDPDDLKALAHPTRMALLGALVTEGPLTASQAAELVGESPSNCSWHLRKLAEHGYVTEAGGGTGRNRPWQAVSGGLEWDEDEDDPAARMAGNALTDALLDRELARLRAARGRRAEETPAWREATELVQSQLWLTAEETTELSARLRELLTAHGERHHDPSLRPRGARLVSLVGWVVPSGSHRVDPGPHPTNDPRDTDDSHEEDSR